MSSSKSKHSSHLEAKTTTPAEFLKKPNNERPSSVQSSNSMDSSTSIFYHFIRKFSQDYKTGQYRQVMRFGARRWRSMILLDDTHNLSHPEIHQQLFTSSKFNKVWNKTKSLETTRSLSSGESFLQYYKCPACGHSRNFRKRSHSSSTTDSSYSESSSHSSASSHQIKKKKIV